MRAGALIGLTVADVDLVRGLLTVRRGKGGKGRAVRIADGRVVSLTAPAEG